MKYPKVIYIGGAPMVGKTTIARTIATQLDYSYISTDDICTAIASVTTPESHSAFHYMSAKDYREYYIQSSQDKLIEEINNQHEALWPALKTLMQNHLSWGEPLVIEGWGIRPSYVFELSGNVGGLFLISSDKLLEERVNKSDFYKGASNEKVMIENFLARSKSYNKMLKEQVGVYGLKSVEISVAENSESLTDRCLEHLSGS